MVLLLYSGPCLLIFGGTVHHGNLQPAPQKCNQCSDKKLPRNGISLWPHQIRRDVVCRISNFIQKLFCTSTVAQKTSTTLCLPNTNFSFVTDFSIWKRQIQKLLKREFSICISCSLQYHKQNIKGTWTITVVKIHHPNDFQRTRNVPGCMKYPPVSWQPHSRRWLANVPCANSSKSFQFQPNS